MTFNLLKDSKSWKPGRIDSSHTNNLSSKRVMVVFSLGKMVARRQWINVFNMLKVEQRLSTYSLTKVLKIKEKLRPSHVKKSCSNQDWLVLDKDRHVSEWSRVHTY